MMTYEDRVRGELYRWEMEVLREPGLLQRTSKRVQTKINEVIPDKVHQAVTVAVRGTVKSVLTGLQFIPKGAPLHGLTLEERDRRAEELIDTYKKIAAAEGAGAGMGGIVMGLVDFGALIAIKMKLLFELAHVYGYDTRDVRERLYLLCLFQLTFSSTDKRRPLFRSLKQWEQTSSALPTGQAYLEQVDWEQLQREYRDAIDFRKMLQLVPGIGAVVGAWANYGLIDELGKMAINCMRMRRLGSAART